MGQNVWKMQIIVWELQNQKFILIYWIIGSVLYSVSILCYMELWNSQKKSWRAHLCSPYIGLLTFTLSNELFLDRAQRGLKMWLHGRACSLKHLYHHSKKNMLWPSFGFKNHEEIVMKSQITHSQTEGDYPHNTQICEIDFSFNLFSFGDIC